MISLGIAGISQLRHIGGKCVKRKRKMKIRSKQHYYNERKEQFEAS